MRFNQGRPYPCLAITGQGFFFAGRGLEIFPEGSPNEKKEPRSTPRLPVLTGTPGGIRTPDPRLRRPLLYPTELLARGFFRGHCIPGEQEKGKGQGCAQPCPGENGAGFSSDMSAPAHGSQTSQAGGEEEQGGGFGDWIDIVRVSFEGQF